MAQSLFNPNTLNIFLSAPPALSSCIIPLSSFSQGITRVQLNYKNLFKLPIQPYKVKIMWDTSIGDASTTIINDNYSSDSIVDPLSTFSPLNSAYSYYVYVPKQLPPQIINAEYNVYYENGVILYYRNALTLISDNTIDLELNVIEVQNTYKPDVNVYNIVSDSYNMVFNSTDLTN